jgi:hypothetical protein
MKQPDTAPKTRIAVYWVSPAPTNCDCCGIPIHNEFVDGATVYGPWANLHPVCHKRIGKGLGKGLGQRYERQPDNRFMRVEG